MHNTNVIPTLILTLTLTLAQTLEMGRMSDYDIWRLGRLTEQVPNVRPTELRPNVVC